MNSAVTPLFAGVRRANIQLRDYQAELRVKIETAWAGGHRNVVAVLPVGGGKTVVFSGIAADERAPVVVLAHRRELVLQMSLALARQGVKHNILAPRPVVKDIVRAHLQEVGYSFFDVRATVMCASVDTLIARKKQLGNMPETVALWIQDEAHHVLRKNKWGKAAALFPNARGLGVTATPERADGKGLGRHADGLFDVIVCGPTLRELIEDGWLTDYKILAPPPSLEMRPEDIGASGDYTQKALAVASKRSRVVGDAVEHYLKYGKGKRWITFTTDLETSAKMAQEFQAQGVPTRAVDGTSADEFRSQSVRMLRDNELLNLVNVDLFGEGFDLPSVAGVSDARPTESFARFVQAIGRMLRPEYAPGYPLDTREQRLAAIAAGPKPYALYIDHAGNVIRHAVARNGVIDVCYRRWSLDGREKRGRRKSGDALELTRCLNPGCMLPYEAVKPACPHCGHKPEPGNRSGPQFVDGDLTELDPAALRQIAREIDRVDGAPSIPLGVPWAAQMAARKSHIERQHAQAELRAVMASWAGVEKARGRCDAERYRLFYRLFGVDVATAKTLGAREARELAEKITESFYD